MPFVVIEGLTVEAAANQEQLVHVEVGDRARAFDGSLRSTIRDRKREWSIVTPAIPRAEADTLLGALDNPPPLTATGDLFGTVGGVEAVLENVQYIHAAEERAIVSFRVLEI